MPATASAIVRRRGCGSCVLALALAKGEGAVGGEACRRSVHIASSNSTSLPGSFRSGELCHGNQSTKSDRFLSWNQT